MGRLSCSQRVIGNRFVVSLEGHLTVSNYEVLDELLDKHGGRDVVIDMKDLVYIDSHTVGMLVARLQVAEQEDYGFDIRNARGHVRKLFDTQQLGRVFRGYASPLETITGEK